jgi:hypothetical protein
MFLFNIDYAYNRNKIAQMFQMVSQFNVIQFLREASVTFLREASVTFVQCSATVIGKFVFNVLSDEYL